MNLFEMFPATSRDPDDGDEKRYDSDMRFSPDEDHTKLEVSQQEKHA